MVVSQDPHKPWQRKTWVQVLAILLGYTLPLLVVNMIWRGVIQM
jgi:hypothetical protein